MIQNYWVVTFNRIKGRIKKWIPVISSVLPGFEPRRTTQMLSHGDGYNKDYRISAYITII